MAGFSDILRQLENDTASRLAAKIPSWAKVDGIRVPSTLSLEQCSSEQTARHKAELLKSLGASAVADLTGGLGVDSWAFSAMAEKVWYNEMNCELYQAVQSNFKALGISNVEFNNFLINKDLPDWFDSLSAFGPDTIFLDPARRSATGRKVFLPEDCSPDFLTLLPGLLSLSRHVVVKLSPMADITMLRNRIGPRLRQVRVVGCDGECKELLCVVDREHTGECEVIAEITDQNFSFRQTEAQVTLSDQPQPGMWIFEPHPALIKAGLHDMWAAAKGFTKADRFTHVYFSTRPVDEAGIKGSARLIEEVVPFNKAGMKVMGAAHPRADVTARGVKISSEELAARMKCKAAGEGHLYAIGAKIGNFLLFTK